MSLLLFDDKFYFSFVEKKTHNCFVHIPAEITMCREKVPDGPILVLDGTKFIN